MEFQLGTCWTCRARIAGQLGTGNLAAADKRIAAAILVLVCAGRTRAPRSQEYPNPRNGIERYNILFASIYFYCVHLKLNKNCGRNSCVGGR